MSDPHQDPSQHQEPEAQLYRWLHVEEMPIEFPAGSVFADLRDKYPSLYQLGFHRFLYAFTPEGRFLGVVKPKP